MANSDDAYNLYAFPQFFADVGGRVSFAGEFGYGGITLRDYFAAAVLGMCAHDIVEPAEIASRCYAVADAMLKESSRALGGERTPR